MLYYAFVGYGNEAFLTGAIFITASFLLIFVTMNYHRIHKDLIWIYVCAGLVYRSYSLHDNIESILFSVIFSYFIAKIVDGVSMKVRHQPIDFDAFMLLSLSGIGLEASYVFIFFLLTFILSFFVASSKKLVFAFSKKFVVVSLLIVYVGMFLPSPEKYKVHVITRPFLSIEKTH